MHMHASLTPEAREALARQVEALRQGFDDMPDHVIVTDADGHIIYANPAVERHTGFSVGEVLGKNPADLWGGHMPKEFYVHLWQTIKGEKRTFRGEVRNRRKDGTEYWQELSITPVLNAAGEAVFFIGIEPDITARKEHEHLTHQTFDLADELNAVIADLNAHHTGSTVSFVHDPGPFPLYTDRVLALQLFKNMLRNAALYTLPAGTAEARLIKNGPGYAFILTDTGPGIPPEDRDKVFREPFRGATAREAQPEGAGLGLYIAKIIADRMGWSISYESPMSGTGMGSRFSVAIPAPHQ